MIRRCEERHSRMGNNGEGGGGETCLVIVNITKRRCSSRQPPPSSSRCTCRRFSLPPHPRPVLTRHHELFRVVSGDAGSFPRILFFEARILRRAFPRFSREATLTFPSHETAIGINAPMKISRSATFFFRERASALVFERRGACFAHRQRTAVKVKTQT